MTTDPIAAAIDHIRSIKPVDNPWTAKDIAFEPQAPDEIDDSIANILNAVVSGQLINRATAANALGAERAKRQRAEVCLEGFRAAATEPLTSLATVPAQEAERDELVARLRTIGLPTAYNAIVQIEALEAENQRLRGALEQIAIQKRTDELVTVLDVEFADFEDGYDHCIDCARDALRNTEANHGD